MRTEHNNWKALPLFMIAVTSAILSSGFCKLMSAHSCAISEPNIDERLLKVREKLKLGNESHFSLSRRHNFSMDENKTFLSQFPSPFRNFYPPPPFRNFYPPPPFRNYNPPPFRNYNPP